VSTSLCLKLRARRLAPGHQAPTLIDCIFLKNVAVATNPSCKQQRSGILQLSEVSCKPPVSQFRFRAIKESAELYRHPTHNARGPRKNSKQALKS